MEIERQDMPQAEYEHEKYIERENEKYDQLAESCLKDTHKALETHKAIMRAMGLDEQYEKHLWDAMRE